MIAITKQLQDDIKSFMTTMNFFQTEAPDIENVYFKAGVSAAIAGLADGDPVTVTSKLTKSQMVNGITFCQEVDDFFKNSAVAQADYNQTCQNIIYGNTPVSPQISVATENVGDRLVNLCQASIDRYGQGLLILDVYTDNEISDIVAVLENQRIIPGSTMTRDDLNLAVTLITQFRNMIGNLAVTTGDYSSTVSKWAQYN